MGRLSRWTLILLVLSSSGCGVKGRPLPPLNPAPIGRGEPTYKEPPAKKPLKKKTNPQQIIEDSETPAEERL